MEAGEPQQRQQIYKKTPFADSLEDSDSIIHVQSGTLTQERSAGAFILLAGKAKSGGKYDGPAKDFANAVERYVSLNQIQG